VRSPHRRRRILLVVVAAVGVLLGTAVAGLPKKDDSPQVTVPLGFDTTTTAPTPTVAQTAPAATVAPPTSAP
jgi:hypothetical protein